MIRPLKSTLPAYVAAREGAAFYRLAQPGFLRITGADRADFIQRQTTNDVGSLSSRRSLLTVLTSAKARILDVWRLLLNPTEEAVDVVTLPERGAGTAAYLQRRIFFMDKVTVTDLSPSQAILAVIGPMAGEVLRQIGLDTPEPAGYMPLTWNNLSVRVVALEGVIGDGFWLLAQASAGDALADALVAVGAAPLDAVTFEMLRIEAGYPGPQGELTETYTPLEVNLKPAVADAKGCYTGQEVIARQITYDKVTRRLAGLRLERPVEAGAEVYVEGRRVGRVTSAVESPTLGPIALAVLKRPHFEAGTRVRVGDADGTQATTVTLPFAHV